MSNDDEMVDDLPKHRAHKRRKVDGASEAHQGKKKQKSDTPKTVNSKLPKKQRRRLKKLLKRASSADHSAPLSGITSESDWNELNRLLNNCNDREMPHVCIQWRDDKPRPPVLDANTHRQLLMRLLQTASGSDKKRFSAKKDESSSYACFSIHNPVIVNHVGVMEVHVENRDTMEQLRRRLDTVAVASPTQWFQNDQPLQSISDALLYKPQKVKTEKVAGDIPAVSSISDLSKSMEPLLLSPEQLQREGYPTTKICKGALKTTDLSAVPPSWSSTRPQDILLEQAHEYIQAFQIATPLSCTSDNEQLLPPYVARQQKQQPSTDRRIFALDCEMVETRTGMELARVTLCQLKSFTSVDIIETELVFDALVRPSNPVLDYKSEYSGMTAAILTDKNNKDIVAIQQVQAALLATIHWNDIVVGHSLENDLRATRWIHENVIDTSVLFRPVRKSHKYSLRHLAAVLLKIQIQQRDKPHCSEEDAVTALKLAVGRVVKGASFRIYEKSSPTNILAELSTQKATVACMGPTDWLQRHVLSNPSTALHALKCDSVSHYNAKAISSWMAVNAVWANFRLQNQADMDQLDKLLKDAALNLLPRAVLMVAIQCGHGKAEMLTKTRAVRRNPKATIPWSDSEDEEWCKVVEKCRQGYVFWISGQLSLE